MGGVPRIVPVLVAPAKERAAPATLERPISSLPLQNDNPAWRKTCEAKL
jgi:hypothetical protein